MTNTGASAAANHSIGAVSAGIIADSGHTKWPGLHEASNLILACGSGDTGCHGWIHAHPREAMSLGYIVSGFNDHPELVPILTAQHGWVLLDDKGGWTRCEPPKQ